MGIINSIELEDVPDYMRPYYFHIKRTVYGHLADYAAFDNEKRRYKTITDMYRDSLLSVNDPESMSYALIHADQLNEKGRPREAIEFWRTISQTMNSTNTAGPYVPGLLL